MSTFIHYHLLDIYNVSSIKRMVDDTITIPLGIYSSTSLKFSNNELNLNYTNSKFLFIISPTIIRIFSVQSKSQYCIVFLNPFTFLSVASCGCCQVNVNKLPQFRSKDY